jgi:hypothetical protein
VKKIISLLLFLPCFLNVEADTKDKPLFPAIESASGWLKGSGSTLEIGIEVNTSEGYWIIGSPTGFGNFKLSGKEFLGVCIQWYPKNSTNVMPRHLSNSKYIPAISGNVLIEKLILPKESSKTAVKARVTVTELVLEDNTHVGNIPPVEAICDYPPKP